MSDHRARSLAAAVGLRTSLLISTLALTAHALFLYGQLVGREDDCPGAGRTHVLVLARLDSARRSYPPFHQRESVILCITHQAGTLRTTLCKRIAVSRRTARTRHHRPRPPPRRLQQHRVRRVGRGQVRLDDGDRPVCVARLSRTRTARRRRRGVGGVRLRNRLPVRRRDAASRRPARLRHPRVRRVHHRRRRGGGAALRWKARGGPAPPSCGGAGVAEEGRTALFTAVDEQVPVAHMSYLYAVTQLWGQDLSPACQTGAREPKTRARTTRTRATFSFVSHRARAVKRRADD